MKKYTINVNVTKLDRCGDYEFFVTAESIEEAKILLEKRIQEFTQELEKAHGEEYELDASYEEYEEEDTECEYKGVDTEFSIDEDRLTYHF